MTSLSIPLTEGELTMSEPLAAIQSAHHAAGQTPPPCVPPLVQRGDEGAQRWKRLLCSSPETLAQRDDIITKMNRAKNSEDEDTEERGPDREEKDAAGLRGTIEEDNKERRREGPGSGRENERRERRRGGGVRSGDINR